MHDKSLNSSFEPQLVEPQWVKARDSYRAGACVELAELGQMIAIRDSKRPDIPPLLFARLAMAAFFDAIKRGEFDDLLGIARD